MKKLSSKKIALLGLLTALSLISYLLESLLPPLFIPGAKIGISNVFTLLSICLISPSCGIVLIVARTVLSSIIVGSMSSFMYSFVAGLIATVAMAVSYKFFVGKISLLSISILGATVHNASQCLVYFLTTGSKYVLFYMPYLILIGIFSGIIVGILTTVICKYKDNKKV